jgi:serine/threonine-protein kinase RsbW
VWEGETLVRIQVALTLPREASSVPLARHTVSAALRSAGVAADCLAEIQVALSEACTNVFRHADAGDSYEVLIKVEDEELTMEVNDEGPGPGERLPRMPDTSAESGRGLALMAAFSDLAVFDSVVGDGGSVHLMKRLQWDGELLAERGSRNGGGLYGVARGTGAGD